MEKITVNLGPRSYPIFVGEHLFDDPELLLSCLPGRDVLVVTNEVVAPLYLDEVKALLKNCRVRTLVLPDGEQHKTLASLGSILDELVDSGFGRDCTVVAVGGGVVGDMAGFAAAVYQRGVAFVQIPTTLLAQVDSSVGGKTAVNHPHGKNLIGAFHQPSCVLADTGTLRTMENREYSAGLAEVIKYGLILDREFFTWLESAMPALLRRETDSLVYAITRSCQLKAEVVARDERESGMRALLNLGHTFGHAIESTLGYGTWLHGEAVAAGMAMAAELSRRHGWLDEAQTARIDALLEAASLPNRPPRLEVADFRRSMERDKKVLKGRVRLVLLRDIGEATVTDDYSHQACDELLRAWLSQAS